jgi:hypothetical protein
LAEIETRIVAFSGWGLEWQLGLRRTMIDALRADISAMARRCRSTLRARRSDMKSRPMKINLAASVPSGDEVPRGFLTVLSPAERTTFTGAAASAGRRDRAAPIATRIGQSRVVSTFRHGPCRYAEQLRQERAADDPELLGSARTSSRTACR